MNKFFLLFLVCIPVFLFAQFDKGTINNDDILKALKIKGINIFKIPIYSEKEYSFNLILEEYIHGELVDSSFFFNKEQIEMLKKLKASITTSKDTNYLRIITTERYDSLYNLNIDYSGVNFPDLTINSSAGKHGSSEFKIFKSPYIIDKGKYPILLLAEPWSHEFEGKKITRYCYNEDINKIKQLINHFFLLYIIVE